MSAQATPRTESPAAQPPAPRLPFIEQLSGPPAPVAHLHELNRASWVTDSAVLSGLCGAAATLLFALWYAASDALQQGVRVFGAALTNNRIDTLLFALFGIASCMFAAEVLRLHRRDRTSFWALDPALTTHHHVRFLAQCLLSYGLYLLVLRLVLAFFHMANEYGYARNATYYQAWFRLLEWVWMGYLWAGLPYAIITRALKYDPASDRRDLTYTARKVPAWLISVIPRLGHWAPSWEAIDRKNGLALMVKLFFTPLMTVFFCDQFPNLVRHMQQAGDSLASGSLQRLGELAYGLSISTIFSIDVALAWCGYMIASRWVDNQTLSVEPTLLGWIVCICCYPPFQIFLGLYFSTPSDHDINRFGNPAVVALFTTLMVLSYFVYMSATLWFGLRFSNLTNRGIIRRGPYAWVRHPAYASKNFAWWCVMFPVVIYNGFHVGAAFALAQFLGLVFMTGFYYLRALTEERHLMQDPHYQAYCLQVPYRFIPKVL